ncbi:MAG: hypothetical protein IE922_16470 [Sphingomonadales bacterium]|nr:hypothetical protein [Sphingomonadales bacterium]
MEHLIRDGHVRRIESLNAYLSVETDAPGPVVFAICDACGRVQQRDAGADVARITRALEKDGFRPTQSMVEVHGRCGDCDAAGGKA